MTGYRDGEEGVVGGGGASGAGRTANRLFFRILVVIVTATSLWVQLQTKIIYLRSTKLAGKQSSAVIEINIILTISFVILFFASSSFKSSSGRFFSGLALR